MPSFGRKAPILALPAARVDHSRIEAKPAASLAERARHRLAADGTVGCYHA